jgi:predicted porin
MKITKIALALAALTGAAAASAQTANVTLYGSIRVAAEVARYNATLLSTTFRRASVSAVLNRWAAA